MSIYKTSFKIKALYAVIETDEDYVYPITNLEKSYRFHDRDLGDYNAIVGGTSNYFYVNCSFNIANRVEKDNKNKNTGVAKMDKQMLRYFKIGAKVNVILEYKKDTEDPEELLIHTGYVSNARAAFQINGNAVNYQYIVTLSDRLWHISQLPSGALFIPHSTGDSRSIMESSIPQTQKLKNLITRFSDQRKELNIAEVAAACLETIIQIDRDDLKLDKLIDIKHAPRLRLKGYENIFIIKYILDIVMKGLNTKTPIEIFQDILAVFYLGLTPRLKITKGLFSGTHQEWFYQVIPIFSRLKETQYTLGKEKISSFIGSGYQKDKLDKGSAIAVAYVDGKHQNRNELSAHKIYIEVIDKKGRSKLVSGTLDARDENGVDNLIYKNKSYPVTNIQRIPLPPWVLDATSKVFQKDQSGLSNGQEHWADVFAKAYYLSRTGSNSTVKVRMPLYYGLDYLDIMGCMVRIEDPSEIRDDKKEGRWVVGMVIGFTLHIEVQPQSLTSSVELDITAVRSEEDNEKLGLASDLYVLPKELNRRGN